MFFYLCLAIGLRISKRYAAWIGSAAVLAFMFSNRPFAGTSIVAKFYADPIAIEFVLGVVCYYICRAIPAWTSRSYCVAAVVVCFSCAVALVAMQSIWPDLEIYRSAAFGIPSFFLVGFASLLSQSQWDIKMSWIVLIGDASYVLYLIHPFCLLFVIGILGQHIRPLGNETVLGTAGTITLSTVMAVLIHLRCERPMVRSLYSRFGRSSSLPQRQGKLGIPILPQTSRTTQDARES
jgi:exopolysaccharide production protein ExoZ